MRPVEEARAPADASPVGGGLPFLQVIKGPEAKPVLLKFEETHLHLHEAGVSCLTKRESQSPTVLPHKEGSTGSWPSRHSHHL